MQALELKKIEIVNLSLLYIKLLNLVLEISNLRYRVIAIIN